VFDPKAFLPDNFIAVLQQWDKNPAAGPDSLSATPHYRLGHYVESLYACLIQDLLGWTILARNLPIRVNGATLGELDFVVLNPHTDAVEHHEIAIKFYLGYHGSCQLPAGWYGPNPQDRLDIKTARMLEQQSQRGLLPETVQVLAQLGIARPQMSRVFMPGYLFYPQMPGLETTTSVATPSVPLAGNVPTNHLRAHWTYLNNITNADTSAWVPLQKPHWLGPWVQKEAPDNTKTSQSFADIAHTKSPRLFATMQYDIIVGLWKETDRVFVVPAHWPWFD
jgi:hypothetical protein